eukprot:TRINITY_DN16375_c1_g1_i2.p2 TRINITY_DN16375_c1_g1~~TRINITY_DN16375_c1_g1_i2.p2  ORF type:complete len:146 (+),score=18.39 TRINITY_DN16375_c1_g1_i2:1-438(+)
MSDTPAIPLVAQTDAALAPHLVLNEGQVGHLGYRCPRGKSCNASSVKEKASPVEAWQRTAMDYFIARLANCVVRVVWSSWVNAIYDHSILGSFQWCPWWYAEEAFNTKYSRYVPPDDRSLVPLLSGAYIQEADLKSGQLGVRVVA